MRRFQPQNRLCMVIFSLAAFLAVSSSWTAVCQEAQTRYLAVSIPSLIKASTVSAVLEFAECRLKTLFKEMPNLLLSNKIPEAVIVQQEAVTIYETIDDGTDEQIGFEKLFLTELQLVERSTAQAQLIYHRGNLQYKIGREKSRETDYDTAIELMTKAIADYKTVLGDYSMSEAMTLDHLADAQLLKGDYQKAREALFLNQKIWIKLMGKSNSGYAKNLVFLGILEIECDELDRAEKYFQEALPLLRKIHGARSVEYAENLVNLANVNAGKKRWVEAAALCESAKSILEERWATNNLVMAHLHSILSQTNAAFEEFDEAEKNMKKTILLHNMYGNPKAPVMRTVLTEYAELLRKMNRVPDAEELEKQASLIPTKKKK